MQFKHVFRFVKFINSLYCIFTFDYIFHLEYGSGYWETIIRFKSSFFLRMFILQAIIENKFTKVCYFFFHFCRTMSLIIMVAFLFTICVLLLNILIAQLSDTYQNVQQDAQRGLEVNRAWIVSRVELNSLYIGKVIRLRGHNTYFNPSLTFTKLM